MSVEKEAHSRPGFRAFAQPFVSPALMPDWLRLVNDWNPITFVVEAMRSLMASGFDWAAIGRALIAIVALGAVLHGATPWAFRRLTSVMPPRRGGITDSLTSA